MRAHAADATRLRSRARSSDLAAARGVAFDGFGAGPRFAAALGLLLALTFLFGGSSQESGIADLMTQLLALPVLVTAVLVVGPQPKSRLQTLALGLAALVAALPAVQLVPLPPSWWSAPPGRAALLLDLRHAGVDPSFHWTLSPARTERALWSELPALAAFFGAVALHSSARAWLSRGVLALVMSSLVLGLLQAVAGQESLFNPFPQWRPVTSGVFANPNHQASALVIGAVLGLAHWLGYRRSSRRVPWQGWVALVCGACCAVALPATGSRAGVLLVVPALVTLLACSGSVAPKKPLSLRTRRVVLVLGLCLALGAGISGLWLFRHTMATEARWPMATATARLAREAWPLGTGVGTFPRWFEQSGPDSLLTLEYINHAHNEYVQWWLEGGIAAVLLLVAALLMLAAVVRALLARRAAPTDHAAWIAVVVLLAGSLVDYPLRTPALMSVGAFFAGTAVARASRSRRGVPVP